jgi:hypothetical protein
MTCAGGVIILPLNFLSCQDSVIRTEFLSCFKILDFKIFQEQVFADTTYTVCALAFRKEYCPVQKINARIIPGDYPCLIELDIKSNYQFAPDLYQLIQDENPLQIKRLIQGQGVRPNSDLFLRTTDTGSWLDSRIGLSIQKAHFYGKVSDRTFASLVLPEEYGNMDDQTQRRICKSFNFFLEEYRKKYHSLYLTNYRDSSSLYPRKRLGFDLAFAMLSYILKTKFNYIVLQRKKVNIDEEPWGSTYSK